jgi:hypothetical protein
MVRLTLLLILRTAIAVGTSSSLRTLEVSSIWQNDSSRNAGMRLGLRLLKMVEQFTVYSLPA